MKILVCFGTRPEAIKMAPVILELKRRGMLFKICVTGQHREMLDQVLDFFEIHPDHDLDLMQGGQTLNELGGKILISVDEILTKEKPDVVLVHGDTSSSALVALAAFHRGIKVGHVEAGLRTYNKQAPFPEEMNRQIIARVADLHFAPTGRAKSNLQQEHIPEEQIYQTGNTIVDALQWATEKMKLIPEGPEVRGIKEKTKDSKKLILVTGHRRENFGEGFRDFCNALLILAGRSDVQIIYPVHLNPQVRGPVMELLQQKENIFLMDPVSYPTMLWLMKNSCFIISDSGGIQEEAPTFNKTILVTRNFTERPEGIESGFSILVGTDQKKILSEAKKILDRSLASEKKSNPYGDGKAAERIVDFLMEIGGQ